jgi:antitoxin VapB
MSDQRVVRVFRSGNSQAVRLPKAVAFADSVRELVVHREGSRLILEPRPENRFSDEFWKALGTLPELRRRQQTRTRRRAFG